MSNDNPNTNDDGKSLAKKMLDIMESQEVVDLITQASTDSLFSLEPTLANIMLHIFIHRFDCTYHGDRNSSDMSPKDQIDSLLTIIKDALSDPKCSTFTAQLFARLREKWIMHLELSTPNSDEAFTNGYFAVFSAFLVDFHEHLPHDADPFIGVMDGRFKMIKEAATDVIELRETWDVLPQQITHNGAFSHVYVGEKRGVQVCIKILKLLPNQSIETIKKEVNVAKVMSASPLFAKLLAWSLNEIVPFMVFELLHGGDRSVSDSTAARQVGTERVELPGAGPNGVLHDER